MGFAGNGQGPGALGAGGIDRYRVGRRAEAGPARSGGDRDPVIMALGGPGTTVRGGHGHRPRSAEVLERLAGGGYGIATPIARLDYFEAGHTACHECLQVDGTAYHLSVPHDGADWVEGG